MMDGAARCATKVGRKAMTAMQRCSIEIETRVILRHLWPSAIVYSQINF